MIGLEINGRFKAYAFKELPKGEGSITDRFAGRAIVLEYNSTARSGTVRDEQGKVIPSINSFWFAWYAFHPETEVYEEGR